MHNPILLTAICAVVSFFIGAIPFGLILGRVFNHTDIRKAGSGNIGTTNALRPSSRIAAAVPFKLPGSAVPSGLRKPCRWLSPSSRLRALMARSKPARANARAVSRPMPRLAPVINATLFIAVPQELKTLRAHHRVHPAINEDDAAGDKAGLGRLQERHHPGDLFGIPGAPQWRDKLTYCLAKPGIVLGGLMQRGFHSARRHHVQANTLRGPLHRLAPR